MTGAAMTIGVGTFGAVVFMSLLWAVQLRTHNASIVDLGWSLSIPALAVFYAIHFETYAIPRVWIAIAFACFWGLRLAAHIHRRSAGHPEDARYYALRMSWGGRAPLNFFLFFQFQALAAVFFSLPYFLIARNKSVSISPLEEIAFVLMWLSLFGESAADQQLARFKRNRSSHGDVCRIGLWKYSRHPNYFFEWMIWVSVAAYAWVSPHGYIAAACPIAMLFFLFKVTGIPATEKQALKSRGDRYRAYQDSTSVFVPWFPRKRK